MQTKELIRRVEEMARPLCEQAVEFKFYPAINGAKTVEGRLVDYDAGAVTIESGGQTVVYEPGDVASVRLTVQL